MEKPFVFGTAVKDANFVGRQQDCQRIGMNFTHGVNTILMSPRRWGKTSIVQRVKNMVQSPSLVVIYMDAFSCRSEYDFCNKFAAEILRNTESRFEEWANLAGEFLTRLMPKISFSPEGLNECSISLGINPKTHSPEEVYQLPELLASKRNIHIVVCIDEFQQIGEFSDSLAVQKRMRSIWQHQEHVSYCLFGSRRHMMQDLFLKRSYPFYKFGDIVMLHPIELKDWTAYIKAGFASEGKEIDETMISTICERMRNNPSYVQQYAWLTLLNTTTSVDKSVLDLALADLLEQNTLLFTAQTEHLTTYQLNFLRAILAGVHTGFSTAHVRDAYNLGSYSNITRLRNSLRDAELIEIQDDGIFISDPVLELWLKSKF